MRKEFFEIMKKFLLCTVFVLVLAVALALPSFAADTSNDDFSTATEITLGSGYTGELSQESTRDYYKFTLDASGKVNLTVTTTMARTYYYIYNESNVRVWGDRYSNGLNQNVDLLAGTYYLYVEKFDNTGNYDFKLSFTPANESCAESLMQTNNALAEASDIQLNQAYVGHLAVNDSLDYYRFTLSAPTKLLVNVTTDMARTYYRIYNSSHTHVWGDRYSEGVSGAEVELGEGTYYFYVEKYDSTGVFRFSLTEEHECVGSFVTTKTPTCTEPGEQAKLCNVCGKQLEVQTLPAAGHSSHEWIIDAEASCSEEGSRHAVCTVCGEDVEETIPKLAHTMGEWTRAKEPTCDDAGRRERACTVCGHVEAEDISQLSHSWGDWKVISGNELIPPIVKEKTCANCDGVERTEDWSYIWVTVIAAVVLIGVLVGVINYVRAFKKK